MGRGRGSKRDDEPGYGEVVRKKSVFQIFKEAHVYGAKCAKRGSCGLNRAVGIEWQATLSLSAGKREMFPVKWRNDGEARKMVHEVFQRWPDMEGGGGKQAT